ncbi:MAG: hypothetical protein JSV40_01285, partial [Deltaproteobacteria bacterium]
NRARLVSAFGKADVRPFYEISVEKGTDKSSLHGYHPRYEAHFGPLRGKSLSLLEIGVQSGASLRLWEEYFPKASINLLKFI